MKKIPYAETIVNFAFSEPGGVISWADAVEVYRAVYEQNYKRFPFYDNFKQNVYRVLKKYFAHVEGNGSRGLYVLKFKLYPHESDDIWYKPDKKVNGHKMYMCESCLALRSTYNNVRVERHDLHHREGRQESRGLRHLRRGHRYFGAYKVNDCPELCDDCWVVILKNKDFQYYTANNG